MKFASLISEAEAAEKRRKEKEEHSLEAYESHFKQIQRLTNESNLEKLVEKFIEGSTFLLCVKKNSIF